MKPRAAKWADLDWNLPNKLLAQQTGTHPKTVNKWRKRLKQAASATPSRKFKRFIDWRKTNAELAAEHGVSRKYLSNLRKRWNAPPAPNRNACGIIHAGNWSAVDWSQSNPAIARLMKCGNTTVRRARRKFAP